MKLISTIGLLVLAATQAAAQTLPLTATSGADIGLEVFSYRYEEDANGAYFMSLDGRKVGISGSLTQTMAKNWYWSADLRYASGSVNYDSASTGSSEGNADRYLDTRIVLGRDFALGNQVLSPFGGLGYRSLYNDLRGTTSTGAVGYRRTSNYIYLPVGLSHRLRAGDGGRLVTTVEYDYLLQGTQKSYVTDVDSTYTSDLVNTQRSGYGARMSIAYEQLNWSVTGFFRYWNIASSDNNVYSRQVGGVTFLTTGYEPHNITREIGVQVKYHFR